MTPREIVEKKGFTKEYINECWGFRDYLRNSSLFPINADNEELIKDFERMNGITLNILTLNEEAYAEGCEKKLHQLWSARYITDTPARLIKTHGHIDLMLIRKQDGYKYDEKIGAKLPTSMNHYIMPLD